MTAGAVTGIPWNWAGRGNYQYGMTFCEIVRGKNKAPQLRVSLWSLGLVKLDAAAVGIYSPESV